MPQSKTERMDEDEQTDPTELEAVLDRLEDGDRKCDRCDEEHDETAKDVRPRRMPGGGAEIICHECWADEVTQHTCLSRQQAAVAALASTGDYSHSEMGRIIGTQRGNISNQLNRLEDKVSTSRKTIEVVEGAL